MCMPDVDVGRSSLGAGGARARSLKKKELSQKRNPSWACNSSQSLSSVYLFENDIGFSL